jgi:L-rhamnose mutarotase
VTFKNNIGHWLLAVGFSITIKGKFMKRYCQTLTLVDNPEMIEKYVEAHAHVWPEIVQGQREVGIVDMQIFRRGRNLFMIMDTVDDFDFKRDMARLATLPRQAEWEAYVSQFQGCAANARSDEKWQLMERIF